MIIEKYRSRNAPAKSRAKRKIPRSSKGHWVGELVFDRGDQAQRLGFGSLLEHNSALCLIYRPGFKDIEEQFAALHFTKPNGKPSKHFFDFRLTEVSGRKICVSVKPEKTAKTANYRALIEEIRRAAVGKICHAVVTVTERNIRPTTLHNAKLFHAARLPEPEIDAAVQNGLLGVKSPVHIGDFLEMTGIRGCGFFSVARAIRFGHAEMFSPERITVNTLITGRAA